MRRSNGVRSIHQPCWPLLVLAGAIGLALLAPGAAAAQKTSITLVVRLWTTEDAPVPLARVQVIDAQSDRLINEGTTDGVGEARFAEMPVAEIRVVVSGRRPDGTPLHQVAQDARGIWVRLPARNWTMDLRADIDGAVFPDLGIAGGGAVDGLDATAIAQGVFELPTAPRATAFPPARTRQAIVVPAAAALGPDLPADPREVSDATLRPGWDITGVALLVALGGITIAVAATIWRGKL